ncbi:MAG: SH3 domain-containing protein [Burkholderiales bacterium]|nr:SH3 domain-containing protein [Burkholderiales bacterium]
MRPNRRPAALAALALLWALTAHADPATVVRATELKKAPASDSETLASLEENAAVQTAERRGGWIQVKTDAGASGWVKFLALRFSGSGAARAGDSGIAQLFNVARGGTSGAQATTGVRGLDAEDISAAQPNAAAVQRMDGFAVSADDAGRFAAEGPLQAQSVDYPPAE